jgi:predicted permease
MSVWQRLFRSEDRKADLDAEIEAHIAMAAADRRERGSGEEQARADASHEFGNVALVKDVTRESWGWTWLERVLQDIRYAFRQFRRSPGFAASVVGTLALGIAATAAMFTVVDHVLLQPLPYPHTRQLVDLFEGRGEDKSSAAYLDIAAWRDRAKSFASIAFFDSRTGRNFVEGKSTTTQIGLTAVSGNFFEALGITPAMGRGLPQRPDSFAAQEDTHTLVIDDTAWHSLFNADPDLLGKSVRLNGESYTVVGIMPRGFYFRTPSAMPQAWSPLSLTDKDKTRTNDTPTYLAFARLQPHIGMAAALAELAAIQKHIGPLYPDFNDRKNLADITVEKFAAGESPAGTSHALLALLAAAGVLWLIACVNAANLILARSWSRQREMAMRGALGASRSRLLQQGTVEGMLISGLASAIGIALALAGLMLFRRVLISNLHFVGSIAPSLTVFAALALLTLVSAVLSSVWPAIIASYAPLEPALRQGGQQSGTSRTQHRLRGALVISQIALSLALLSACGLLLRTIYSLRHVPLGFRTDHIFVANLEIPTYRFSKVNATKAIYEPLLERVQHLPGVDSAALLTEVPLGHTFFVTLSLSEGDMKGVPLAFKAASPDLQSVFGFKMLRGRYFNSSDTPTSEPVVVVNRAFAQKLAPHEQDPGKVIGKELIALSHSSKARKAVIIGVLEDFRQNSISAPSQPEVELSIGQITPDSGFYTVLEGIAMDLAVRTRQKPETMIPLLRTTLRSASPELENSNFTTMDQIVEDSYGSQMLAARLLEVFAGSALMLCVAGLYGLLAYVVSQRTREMGVRFALGAERSDVVWLVMRQAGVLIVAGVAIGMGLAFFSGRLVRTFLYGVSPHDGWTLAAVAIVLTLSGAVAAYLPALRAAGVDPVEALRAE